VNICLITAPTVTDFGDPEELGSDSVQVASSEPSLGVLSLAAVLEKRKDHVRILNLNRTYLAYSGSQDALKPQPFAEVAAQLITETGADVYGFGSICSSYPLTIRIAEAVKALRPKSTILLGGPQASVVDVNTLSAFAFVDLVLRGEAENSLPVLLDELGGERQLERVPGLSYRSRSQIQRNPNSPVIENLDALPLPAYHLTEDLQHSKRAVLEMGRGCPFACTFCSTNDFFRRNFRLRSPARILQDMRDIAASYSIRDFNLVHDMFTIDRRRVVAFCEAMIASNEHFTWSCSARTDCVDEELLELMARAGCRGVFFGVEVGSDRMQKIIDKNLSIKRAEEIIDITDRLGMHSTVSLITGFPEETWDDLRQTVHMFTHSARCTHSSPQLNILAPLAGTPLYSEYRHEMVLEELCSPMSHQGKYQNEADTRLIQQHPEIFPNFYLLPTPHLDRSCLLELREFALMGVARFRWLLSAIHQNTTGLLEFFKEWYEHRLHERPGLVGSKLRSYYRTSAFRADFVAFVGAHRVGKNASVEALVEYEKAMMQCLSDTDSTPIGELIPQGANLWWSDIPIRRPRIRTVTLSCDIQRVLDGLKTRSEPMWARGLHFYIAREVSPGLDRLDQVSDWLASLIRACDGRSDIEEVVQKLSPKLGEIEIESRAYVLMRLLQGAQGEGVIEIYRA
jgi:radical SAM superfamily enzyme YgiQ (UPF0313 family)